MRLKSKFFTLAFVLFLSTSIANAQQINFSGTWKFINQESISGNLYSDGSPKQVTITHANSMVSIASTIFTGSSDTVMVQTLTSDKPLQTQTKKAHRTVISTLQWSTDSLTFTVITTIYSKADASKADYHNVDIWRLEDGKLLLDRKSERFTDGDIWESIALYEKQ